MLHFPWIEPAACGIAAKGGELGSRGRAQGAEGRISAPGGSLFVWTLCNGLGRSAREIHGAVGRPWLAAGLALFVASGSARVKGACTGVQVFER